MATRPERRITYADYVTFPDNERWEIVDGEAFLVPSPNARHQRVQLRLAVQISKHLEAHGGGELFIAPFDVVLDPGGDIVQPDLVFIADEDMDVLTEANVWGRPSWAIEVLSPSHADRDRKLKLGRYEHFGVPEYWICDPDVNAVEIYRLDGERYGEPVVARVPDRAIALRPSGLSIDLSDVFST
jgi:Uma2 family endonuclease